MNSVPYDDSYYSEHLKKIKKRFGKHRIKNVLNLIDTTENDGIWLDLGCGIGTFTSMLAKKNFDVVGVDLSGSATKIAKNLLHKECLSSNSELIKADICYLPFKQSSFNNIICADLVEHLDSSQYYYLISESYRILSKNGKLALYTPNPTHIFEKMRKQNFILKKDESHIGLKTCDYLITSLRKHNFLILKSYFKESHILFFNLVERFLMKIPIVSKFFRRRICILAEKFSQ